MAPLRSGGGGRGKGSGRREAPGGLRRGGQGGMNRGGNPGGRGGPAARRDARAAAPGAWGIGGSIG